MRTNRTRDNSDTNGKSQAVLFLSMARARPGQKSNEPIAIGAQRDLGHGRAHAMNADIVGEFVEMGAAATRWQTRPVVNELLDYLDEHPTIRYVVFPGLHRFSRNHADFVALQRRFEELEVDVVCASGERIVSANEADAFVEHLITAAQSI